MRIIGITGRSGCGKSTLTNMIAARGYPCVDADVLSRQILLPGSPCLGLLQQAFGADILDGQGVLRRRLLADRAFATPQGTATLNRITHPEILRRLDAQIDTARSAGERLFFVDGAVILGTPFHPRCDSLVVVVAPYAQSVERICLRDGIPPEMARRRLDAQTPEDALRQAADRLLVNDGTMEQFQEQCQALLQALEKEENA